MSEATPDITVDVEPAFREDESSPNDKRFVFSYTVTVHNHSDRSVQLLSQPSPSTRLPSSHSSPAVAFIQPSPHSATVQSALQSSDSPASSQASPVSRIPLPQKGM